MSDTITIPKKTLKRIVLAMSILVALTIVLLLIRGPEPKEAPGEPHATQPTGAESKKSSSIAGHTHGIPARVESPATGGPVRYAMSEEAKMLAEVLTVEVKRERAPKKLRMVGMVFQDETRNAVLTSRVDGRLDEVYVDFTGVKVVKGDPMVNIWSPTLIKAQVELFETIRSRAFGEDEVRGTEERLVQFGLTPEQVKEIKQTKKPFQNIVLRAPISGIVMKKNALVGDFVKEGTVMYDISDLSRVWVKLDAYEPDLPWIRYGQRVTFAAPSFPGKTFKGKVIFIEPVLDMETRTVKVRVDAPNPDYELKPHMFANAELEAEVDEQGRVIKPEWAGKYICPFDPEEVSDVPGTCPRTKQPLQPATAYGYSGVENPVLPLVIPESSVLFTGKRSLVYVEVPNQDKPTYEQRKVVLGPRAGDNYVILEGLKEGERVVVKGNFEIDSSVQIAGQPSMMFPVEPEKDGQETKKVIPSAPDAYSGHGKPPEAKAPEKKTPEAGAAPHSAHGKEGH